ncbi:hypothetical protein C8R45DRAFT_929353 [Mycena sanguinolenta]|nr:hypothetical protein C8R45DRAFT_929353 [Mycena sanguinolenta]
MSFRQTSFSPRSRIRVLCYFVTYITRVWPRADSPLPVQMHRGKSGIWAACPRTPDSRAAPCVVLGLESGDGTRDWSVGQCAQARMMSEEVFRWGRTVHTPAPDFRTVPVGLARRLRTPYDSRTTRTRAREMCEQQHPVCPAQRVCAPARLLKRASRTHILGTPVVYVPDAPIPAKGVGEERLPRPDKGAFLKIEQCLFNCSKLD